MPSLETSNPVGAVAVILAVRLAPLMLKVCAAEAVPYVVVNAAAVAAPVMVGDVELIVTVKVGKVAAVPLLPNHFVVSTRLAKI